ncbi:MAG: carbon storage regulator [Oscillospiraceae bacterium]|nr:carbon storage regulator [Oscillospiraceae bacterium]
MLSISMMAGDYFTVGGETVVQLERLRGDRAQLFVSAPRAVPILRGDVLERQGGQRPACVREIAPPQTGQLPWTPRKRAALAELRRTLDRMDSSPEVQTLREKLEIMFPEPTFSNG